MLILGRRLFQDYSGQGNKPGPTRLIYFTFILLQILLKSYKQFVNFI